MLIKDVVNFVTLRPQELVFDFKRKIAGSDKECPMKLKIISYSGATPTSPSGGWVENNDQTNLNKVKYKDNNTVLSLTPSAGLTRALMIELDLNFIPNFDKTKVKSISIDSYARGSGSNGGVLTNGVRTKLWENTGNTWVWAGGWENTTSSITKMTCTPGYATDKVDANKKTFILLHSTYASDGTIASTVELDYIRVTIKLN